MPQPPRPTKPPHPQDTWLAGQGPAHSTHAPRASSSHNTAHQVCTAIAPRHAARYPTLPAHATVEGRKQRPCPAPPAGPSPSRAPSPRPAARLIAPRPLTHAVACTRRRQRARLCWRQRRPFCPRARRPLPALRDSRGAARRGLPADAPCSVFGPAPRSRACAPGFALPRHARPIPHVFCARAGRGRRVCCGYMYPSPANPVACPGTGGRLAAGGPLGPPHAPAGGSPAFRTPSAAAEPPARRVCRARARSASRAAAGCAPGPTEERGQPGPCQRKKKVLKTHRRAVALRTPKGPAASGRHTTIGFCLVCAKATSGPPRSAVDRSHRPTVLKESRQRTAAPPKRTHTPPEKAMAAIVPRARASVCPVGPARRNGLLLPSARHVFKKPAAA